MKTCGKLVSMVLSICMIISMFVMPAMAADYNVEMVVSATEVKKGDTITVEISNKEMSVDGFGFSLEFDSTILKLTSIVGSDEEYPDYLGINKVSGKNTWADLTTWSTLEEANANNSFAAGLINTAIVDYKAGMVTTLTFEAIATGNVELVLNDASTAGKEVSFAGVAQTATVTVASDEPVHTHDWAETWSKDEADHWKTCSGCTEPGEKAAHTWNEGEVTTEPTETTTGVKTYTCTVCDQTKTEEIPMIPVAGAPIVEITEEVTGENELTLTFTLKNNAGFKGYGLYVEYDETAMTLKALNAGALSTGLFTANVDEAYANFANAKEVTGDGVLFTAVFDTTNAKAGEYEFTLSGTMTNASYAKEEVEVAPYTYTITCTAHVWGEWEVTTPATCTEDGVKTRVCSFCGETETDAIPALGHTWGEWEVTTPATCTEAGVKTRTCSVCGETETAAIPAAGHNWGGDNICDDCGAEKSAGGIDPVGPSKGDIVLPFVDVTVADWFYNDVVYVYENGLMNGTSATTFSPYGITTRGQIVTILWRLEGQPAVSSACPFMDVAVGSYYENAITWAAANGIVTGYSATAFGPDDQITREQMATILYRYAKNYKGYDVSVGESTNILSYTDAFDISEYAYAPLQWACGAGLINGMGDGGLAPQGQANRAQAAAILHRFCEMDAK